jgi:phosphomannomutase
VVERPDVTLIATHSGLRGRPGADLTRGVVEGAVTRLVDLLRERALPPSLGVARDDRPEGLALAESVTEAARRAGVDVVDFGVAATPAAKLAARRRGLGGAVVVTGSHLPSAMNGLKLFAAPTYRPLDIRRLPDGLARASARRGRLRRDHGAADEHIEAVLRSIDADRVRLADLAAECSGGAGRAPSRLLEALGCRRPAARKDVGLRLDADADRLQLVDERRRVLDPEFTLPLVLLSGEARTLVRSSDTSRMVDAIAAGRGGSVQVVAPGELHLIQGLADTGAELAGEGNGGVIIPAVGLARDGLAAAAAVLSLLARGSPLSSLIDELPQLNRFRSTVALPPDRSRAGGALRAVAERLGVQPRGPEGAVRVETPSGAWGLVRRSATEPVFRVTAEAPDAAEAGALHAELRAALVKSAGRA